jgi:hypothetical protein
MGGVGALESCKALINVPRPHRSLAKPIEIGRTQRSLCVGRRQQLARLGERVALQRRSSGEHPLISDRTRTETPSAFHSYDASPSRP